MLLFCANEKKFSFRWIDEQFVQVHPGKNVSESGSVFQEISEVVGVKVQLGVINVQMVFEGIF